MGLALLVLLMYQMNPELGEGRVRKAYQRYVQFRYANTDLTLVDRLKAQAEAARDFDPEEKVYFSILCNEFDRADHRATADVERNR